VTFPSYLKTPRDAAGLRRLACIAPGPPADDFLGCDEKPVAVAFYPATNADGGDVTVTVLRLPAMFYEIHCPAKGIHLGTGSGGEDLVHAIAAAVADGTLGIASDITPPTVLRSSVP
jgi:hypothetical protein